MRKTYFLEMRVKILVIFMLYKITKIILIFFYSLDVRKNFEHKRVLHNDMSLEGKSYIFDQNL